MAHYPINEIWTRAELEAIGGKFWSTSDGNYQRIYFNDLSQVYGLDCAFYSTGHVSSARLNGERISNSKAAALIHTARACKLFYDLTTDSWGRKGDADEFMDVCVARLRARLLLVAAGEAA